MSGALAVICARGGSKGLPRKNVLDLGGKPMVAWSVAASHAASRIDRTILSTDDLEIADAARRAGCDVPFMRPPELATDEASIYDVLFHALDHAGADFDLVVLLQATSPLRRAQDIDACVELCGKPDVPAVLSVSPAAKPPHWLYRLDGDMRLLPGVPELQSVSRRQEAPDYFAPNGAVYVAKTDWLRMQRSFAGPDTRAYVMSPWRSIDVDGYLDLVLARALLDEIEKGNLA